MVICLIFSLSLFYYSSLLVPVLHNSLASDEAASWQHSSSEFPTKKTKRRKLPGFKSLVATNNSVNIYAPQSKDCEVCYMQNVYSSLKMPHIIFNLLTILWFFFLQNQKFDYEIHKSVIYCILCQTCALCFLMKSQFTFSIWPTKLIYLLAECVINVFFTNWSSLCSQTASLCSLQPVTEVQNGKLGVA